MSSYEPSGMWVAYVSKLPAPVIRKITASEAANVICFEDKSLRSSDEFIDRLRRNFDLIAAAAPKQKYFRNAEGVTT